MYIWWELFNYNSKLHRKKNNNNNNLNTELNPFGISKPEIVIDATYVINNKKYDISFIIITISTPSRTLQLFNKQQT
jgi:hypothetical protein